MVRPRSHDFLPRLYEAALRVFARHGLKHSRMSDIARAMGVSHGSLYNYVETKEALFFWLVDCGLEPPGTMAPGALPIRAKSTKQLLSRLREQIGATFALPHLEAALLRPHADVRGEVSAIVLELYDRTLASRLQAAALERSAVDIPELFTLFYLGVRRRLFEQLTRYIVTRINSGHFAAVEDPVVAARFVLETITFFARHRFNDRDFLPDEETVVRRTVAGLLVRSLLNGAEFQRNERRPAARRR